MDNSPQPNITSRRIVERALNGELPPDALLDYIARLEQRASVAGQFAAWFPRLLRQVVKLHPEFSPRSSVNTTANQILIDLGKLGSLTSNQSKP